MKMISLIVIAIVLSLPSSLFVEDLSLTYAQPPSTRKSIERFTNSIGMAFVMISAGSFVMGSPSNEEGRESDEDRHRVTITLPFFMQTTEVTQTQWKMIMGDNPSHFKGDDLPVETVSWNDVQEFIQELNHREGTDKYRLPMEVEWEFASRAGTDTPFSFGACLSTDHADYDGRFPLSGCSEGGYREKTAPVTSFAPNVWGLFDMHGNVWEWCQDRYGKYPSSHVSDPKGSIDGSFRVLRGGSWDVSARSCRSANRGRSFPASVE